MVGRRTRESFSRSGGYASQECCEGSTGQERDDDSFEIHGFGGGKGRVDWWLLDQVGPKARPSAFALFVSDLDQICTGVREAECVAFEEPCADVDWEVDDDEGGEDDAAEASGLSGVDHGVGGGRGWLSWSGWISYSPLVELKVVDALAQRSDALDAGVRNYLTCKVVGWLDGR